MCIRMTRDVISTRRVSYEWGCTFLKWKTLTPPNSVTRWYTTRVVGVSAFSARSPLSPPFHPSTCPDSTWQKHDHPRPPPYCPWLIPSSRHHESIYFLYKSFKQHWSPPQSRQGSSNPSSACILESFNATPYGTGFHVTYDCHLYDTDCS